jgi:hypothetical protein
MRELADPLPAQIEEIADGLQRPAVPNSEGEDSLVTVKLR